MKKIFMVFALMAMLMLPFTSFSMTAMEEGDLSSVTGQAGVSINLDAVIDLNAEVVAWGDNDGFDGFSATQDVNNTGLAGWVGLADLAVNNLRVRADMNMLWAQWFIEEEGGTALVGTFQAAATALGTSLGTWLAVPNDLPAGLSVGFTINEPTTWTAGDMGILAAAGAITAGQIGAYQAAYTAIVTATGGQQALLLNTDITTTPFAPLTIDVATDGTHGPGITFVRIGTGSLQVEMDSLTSDVRLGPDNGSVPGVPDFLYELGSLYLEGLSLRIGGGSYVDIFNARGGTAQGVSIATNILLKDFNVDILAWGDRDGIDYPANYETTQGDLRFDPAVPGYDLADYPNQGWVGLKDLAIKQITVVGQIDIDVATDSNDWTFVQIGLGTDAASGLHVGLSGLTATAALGPERTNLSQELGELYVSGATVIVYGDLQIGARADGTQGVTINLADLSVDISTGLTVSWGDLDGIGAGTTAGYVGLSNLNIVGLSLSGNVTIDVATVDDTVVIANIYDKMYHGYVEHNVSPTFVHIGLGTGNADDDDTTTVLNSLNIAIESLSASVSFANNAALAPVAALSPNLVSRTIGTLYLGGINVGMNGWLDIAAH